jgi:hypothetical protein
MSVSTVDLIADPVPVEDRNVQSATFGVHFQLICILVRIGFNGKKAVAELTSLCWGKLRRDFEDIEIYKKPISHGAWGSFVNPSRFSASSSCGVSTDCSEHGVVSDIEMIPIQKVNEASERVIKSDVKYRFVIDMKSLK